MPVGSLFAIRLHYFTNRLQHNAREACTFDIVLHPNQIHYAIPNIDIVKLFTECLFR